MQMIDHILTFPTEADAIAALKDYRVDATPEGAKQRATDWNRSVTFPDIVPLTAGGKLSGWWIMISLDRLDKALASMPECVIITDRDEDAQGKPAIKNDADASLKLDTATLESIIAFAGKPAGARYETTSFQADKVIDAAVAVEKP
jgi:hypothetical protein